jgi:hypothetical protein
MRARRSCYGWWIFSFYGYALTTRTFMRLHQAFAGQLTEKDFMLITMTVYSTVEQDYSKIIVYFLKNQFWKFWFRLCRQPDIARSRFQLVNKKSAAIYLVSCPYVWSWMHDWFWRPCFHCHPIQTSFVCRRALGFVCIDAQWCQRLKKRMHS